VYIHLMVILLAILCVISGPDPCTAQSMACTLAPACAPPAVPSCDRAIVPIGPCCQRTILFPPAPMIVAPVTVGCAPPVPYYNMYQPSRMPPGHGSIRKSKGPQIKAQR